jgi:hypothetical protein
MAEPQISQISSSQTTIPDYAKPYVQKLLGQAQAVTDTTQNPYMQYMGERVAQFTPLQQQAYEGAQGMQVAPQLQKATDITGLASQAALNYGEYNPGTFSAYTVQNPNLNYYQMDPSLGVTTDSFTRPSTQEAYMSPYMRNVVERQQADAQRQSDIASQIQGAQAARSGAFGGSGDYLMRGQARNNLARLQGDIFAQGQQAAFQQGQQQFNQEQAARLQANLANQQAGLQVGGQNLQAKLGVQQLGAGQDIQAQLANQNQLMQAQQLAEQSRQYGAGLGLQGLQTALTGAGQLGSLGQNQFGQQMGINQLQSAYGGQQQQQVQNILNNQYQDYLGYQNYPYKQLGFMSDMLRGLPLTQQSNTIYQQAPSMVSQVAGLGGAALTGAKLFGAKGGATGDLESRPAGLAELAVYNMG